MSPLDKGYAMDEKKRLIYDCFMFYNELNMLELKLAEEDSVVDKFVLVESCETYSGKPKRYLFDEHKDRFAQFSEKIIHIKLEPQTRFKAYPFKKCGKNWAREYWQRDQIARGLVNANNDDLIIISDVDEIISSSRLSDVVAGFRSGGIGVFEMPLFQFSVNREWVFHDRRLPQYRSIGPRMVSFKDYCGAQRLRKVKKIYPNWLKNDSLLRPVYRVIGYIKYRVFNELQYFEDTGWHFSSMGSWDFFKNKVNSFAHQDWKKIPQYTDREFFEAMAASEVQTRPYPLERLPSFILDNRSMFIFR